MNDAQEIEYAAMIVAEESREMGNELLRGENPDLSPPESLESINEWLRVNKPADDRKDAVPNVAWVLYSIASLFVSVANSKYNTNRDDTYAACFTTQADSLGQWRGYAGGGGYAIGFRYETLSQLGVEGTELVVGEPRQVAYGKGGGKKEVARFYREFAGALISSVEKAKELEATKDSQEKSSSIPKFSHRVAPNLSELATVKHEAFSDEREWRLIFSESRDTGEYLGDFRPGGVGGILPFIRLKLTKDSIACVRVGPGEETPLRVLMAEHALARFGHLDVDVLTSDAPYRP